jgi:hypothetical protein
VRVVAAAVAGLVSCTIGGQRAEAQADSALSAEQRGELEAGRPIVVSRKEPTSPWPRMQVYKLVDATPEEAAAVFTDYDRHSMYIPGLPKSRVAHRIDELTADVDYTLNVPMLPDEHYTVRDRLSLPDSGDSYVVTWTMVKATSTRAIDGSVRFEQRWNARLQRPATLMLYENFVIPGSRLGGIPPVRRRAVAQMVATARAIAAEIERERREDRGLLETQLAVLRGQLQKSSRKP